MLSSECINVAGVAQKGAVVCQLAMPQLAVCVEPPGVYRPRGRCNQAVMSPAGHLRNCVKLAISKTAGMSTLNGLPWHLHLLQSLHVWGSNRAADTAQSSLTSLRLILLWVHSQVCGGESWVRPVWHLQCQALYWDCSCPLPCPNPARHTSLGPRCRPCR